MAFEFYILPSRVSYKTSPELGSSQTATLFLMNAKQPPIEQRKRKKMAWIFSWERGLEVYKGKGKCIRNPKGGGVRPAAISSCSVLCLQGHRGQAAWWWGAAPSSPPAPAQLLRDTSCQLSHPLSCSGCSSGLRLGAIKLQCLLCLLKPVLFDWWKADSRAYLLCFLGN